MIISNPLLRFSKVVGVVYCIITIVGVGCTNSNLIRIKDTYCETKITGNCIVDPSFKFNFSAIIIKEYGNQKLIPGTIILKDSSGVVFKADEGYFKGENKLYKYKNIICVIDTNHKAIYGTIPEEYYHSWKSMLRLTNAKTGIDQYLTFEPNQPFELCIHPGV
ncbi:MAG: hypothetical protein JNJ85_03555, partial [Candidatus Kapabacteria bacterium]|nr:hypothetical protein [Candidatus Kapabacteria bacterium]